MTQQCPAPDRADTLDIVEYRAQPRATAKFAVVGNCEPVGFVTHPYEKEQGGRVPGQYQGVFAIGQEDALFRFFHPALTRVIEDVLLGDRNHIDLIRQPCFFKNFNRYIKLTFATINYPEIGEVVLFDCAPQSPAKNFVHAGVIVLAFDGADAIAAIQRFLGFALIKRDLRGDHH